MRLAQKFYNQPTRRVAQQLLGMFLVYQLDNKKIVCQITETEAYVGPNDLASHASRGRTARTEIMFGPAGYWYVYLVYGMYYCLNIITERKDYPAAVLIRSIKPITGIDLKIKMDGPGKLCRALGITKQINGTAAFGKTAQFWIENRNYQLPAKAIKKARRIGVDYAAKDRDRLWRYYIDPIILDE